MNINDFIQYYVIIAGATTPLLYGIARVYRAVKGKGDNEEK
jgi:hypothetical protein